MSETSRSIIRICAILYIVSLVVICTNFSHDDTTKFLESNVAPNKKETEASESERIVVPYVRKKQEFPAPQDQYFEKMIEQTEKLSRSSEHQKKFLSRRSTVPLQFEERLRFQAKPEEFGAIVISDAFAFLHVWKCGGTTVAEVVRETQYNIQDEKITSRDWVAVVRDPIERFLSAWAECGYRYSSGAKERVDDIDGINKHSVLNWFDAEYDFRVRAFLLEVQSFTFPRVVMSCHRHALPQANFMMDENGHVDQHVKIVGDLSELPGVLDLAGRQVDSTDLSKERDSSTNSIKKKHFPSRRDLLTDQTILELCRFFALDYYLFEFDAPTICVQDGGPLAVFY